MQRFCCLLVSSALVLSAGACRAREDRQPQPAFRPTATVKDIMVNIVDPGADVLWNAVATIVTISGTEEREPRTDEEWTAVQRSAVQLVEATNLLRVPGRLVAKPGEKSENPRIELHPETIQKLIVDDPATWASLVDGLHDASVPALNAANTRNAKGLFDAGEKIEHACETCHQHYWYPPQSAAAWKIEAATPAPKATEAPAPVAKGGTIKGHVRVKGPVPGNAIIRMGMDPMCAKINAGKRPVQEVVAATADGSLANVFVSLQGSFPATPVPSEPVTIDQRACMYVPRVVGARVGQTVQVRNSDELLHNVHGLSTHDNAFNVSQPKAGMVQQIQLKTPEIMVRVTCDVHRWMTAFVGVVNHPYFATSSGAGTYEINNVPEGTYTIQAWHERYGVTTQQVRVAAGTTATVDFAY
jgi:plastocyanin